MYSYACVYHIASGQWTVDDGQTNSVLFHLSFCPSSSRALFFSLNLSGRRSEAAGSLLVDDGQTNSVLFD